MKILSHGKCEKGYIFLQAILTVLIISFFSVVFFRLSFALGINYSAAIKLSETVAEEIDKCRTSSWYYEKEK